MSASYKNSFRFTTDSILDAQGGAIVIPVDMMGKDITYPYADFYHRFGRIRHDLMDWRHHPPEREPAKTMIVDNRNRDKLKFERIIYTIVPFYNNDMDWFILCDCYRNCLNIAAENGITTVAFPFMGGGRIHYRPEKDLFFYVRSVINETVSSLGGSDKMDVSVQLPKDLYDCMQKLEDIINGSADASMPLSEAEKWIGRFEGYISTDVAADRKSFDVSPWKAREQKLSYDVGEYIKDFVARADHIGDLIRENQRAGIYEQTVKKIKQEKEAYIAKAKSGGDAIKSFRADKIDSIITKWCCSSVPEKKREKYERLNNSRSKLASTVGISSQFLSTIPEKKKLPARETLLALAVGMKLPYEERLELVLTRDEDIRYPSTEKEKLIERCLAEVGYLESDMSYTVFDTIVYERSGNKFCIYENKSSSKK